MDPTIVTTWPQAVAVASVAASVACCVWAVAWVMVKLAQPYN